MLKRHLIYILLLLTTSLSAQEASVDSISPSTTSPGKFKTTLKKFFNFSDFDTLYIAPNRYNYALMTTHFSNFEYYSVSSTLPEQQTITLYPNPRRKLGFYFGWRWIFLGWSFNIDDIYRKTSQENKGTEFDLSLYSSKFGLDLFYRKTGNNYQIKHIKGFEDAIPSNYSQPFNGLKVNIKGLTLYYILNNRKFSYPAAFSQSTNQRKSAGSMIVGVSFSKHNLDFDYTQLPVMIQERMNPGMKVENIHFSNFAVSYGYAYNWVFARNFLFNASLTPAIAYKTSHIVTEANKDNRSYNSINLDLIVRAGLVYNNSKYYIGTSFLGKTYNYYKKNFSMNNGFGTLQIYAGFNFYLKKEYRKKRH